MRNKRRNDNYIASRLDRIINKLPSNPNTGFTNSSTTNYQNDRDYYEIDDDNNPYE